MFDYSKIPVGGMVEGMRNYMEHGIPAGSFMMALLENDFCKICQYADDANRVALFQWARWLWNEAPMASYGSPAKVEKWMAARRAERNAAAKDAADGAPALSTRLGQ